MARRRLWVGSLLGACAAVSVVSTGARPTRAAQGATPVPPSVSPEAGLRALFEARDVTANPVGRVAARLLVNGASELVNVGRTFHAGERFQFEITSSLDGWVSVVHRSPGKKVQLLWPRLQPGAMSSPAQRIEAGVMYLVPPHPGTFQLDQEVGKETFFIVISTNPESIRLDAFRDQQAAQSQANGHAVDREDPDNFAVRQLSEEASRSVMLNPGPTAADPYVYFSAARNQGAASAVIEIELNHVN